MNSMSSDKLLDSLFDGIYFVDTERRITYWNAGAERISGYSRTEVLGSCCADNLLQHIDTEGRNLCRDGCPLAATMLDGKAREAKVFLHHRLGHRVPVSVRASPVRNEQGAVIGAVEIFSDNSNLLQILQDYEQLKQEAFLDPLTKVGNRRYGEMTLSTRVYDLHSHRTSFGVLFMDIDHFKLFNDRYGHKIGDDVLVMVAKSISTPLRKIDVAIRWGGEEFVVILPGGNGCDNQGRGGTYSHVDREELYHGRRRETECHGIDRRYLVPDRRHRHNGGQSRGPAHVPKQGEGTQPGYRRRGMLMALLTL